MNKFNTILWLSMLILPLFFFSCTNQPMETKEQADTLAMDGAVQHPSWSRNAVIYKINVRQFTSSGTFNGVYQHLLRLYNMGMDILWLMPVQPLDAKNQNNQFGSYYSIKDYKDVNSSFGSMNTFKALVDSIHSAGMHVIIDWAATHTTRDNSIAQEHPGWYKKDGEGEFVATPEDDNFIAFDYSNEELQAFMVDALKFWIDEANVDGFHCRNADMVPVDFWLNVRRELITSFDKEIMLVAESENPELHDKAFDMTYDNKFYQLMLDIYNGEKSAQAIKTHFEHVDSAYLPDAYLMQYTSNHDENTWEGSAVERFGDAAKTFAVLAGTVPDMLMVYNGQEAGMDRSLKYFEKDSVDWSDPDGYLNFYTALATLKKDYKALWNGDTGGKIEKISTSNEDGIFAFYREAQGDMVLVILNLSNDNQSITIEDESLFGNYIETFSRLITIFNENNNTIELDPWEYLVYEKK